MPTRLERLVCIKQEIDRGGYPDVQKLCAMFEIQPRTLHEDIRMMREMMGLEIRHDKFHNGYVNANPSKKLPTFDLTAGEVFALTLAKEMLAEYTGTPFHPILRSALEKIQERLPARVQLEVGDVEAAVEFGRMPMLPFSKKMFLDLHKACEKRLQTQIEYKSASKGELTDRSVNPCKLLAHQNSWYLVAYCNLRKDLRLFALHRIQQYAVGATTFEPVAQETLDSWLKSPLFIEHQEQAVDVVIKFGPRATRYVREKVWHPTQKLDEREDGTSTLAFTTSSVDEVKRWVLTYGDDAEVVAPAELRASIAAALRAAAGKYSDL